MTGKSEKAKQLIIEQIKGHGGDSSSAVAWRSLGGGFDGGRAVGTVTIKPSQMIFAMGVNARLSEAAREGKLLRRSRPVCAIKGTSGDGYWVSGALRSSGSVAPVTVGQGVAKSAESGAGFDPVSAVANAEAAKRLLE